MSPPPPTFRSTHPIISTNHTISPPYYPLARWGLTISCRTIPGPVLAVRILPPAPRLALWPPRTTPRYKSPPQPPTATTLQERPSTSLSTQATISNFFRIPETPSPAPKSFPPMENRLQSSKGHASHASPTIASAAATTFSNRPSPSTTGERSSSSCRSNAT